jgi:GT2 family glycosyltransferase
MIEEEFPWVELIVNKRNLGFSKANNQGIKYALKKKTDYILLLNNDTEIIYKDWLKEMIKTAESDLKIGIVGCKLIYPNGKEQYSYGQIAFNKKERGKFSISKLRK